MKPPTWIHARRDALYKADRDPMLVRIENVAAIFYPSSDRKLPKSGEVRCLLRSGERVLIEADVLRQYFPEVPSHDAPAPC